MANKWVVMPKGVINSVVIIIMRISIVDFHVILKEDGAYPMILSTKPQLTKSHARNYWGERYMTIKIHFNWEKIPFVNFVKNSKGMNEYDNNKKQTKALILKGFTQMIPMKKKWGYMHWR